MYLGIALIFHCSEEFLGKLFSEFHYKYKKSVRIINHHITCIKLGTVLWRKQCKTFGRSYQLQYFGLGVVGKTLQNSVQVISKEVDGSGIH